jgi:hypothetical protein
VDPLFSALADVVRANEQDLLHSFIEFDGREFCALVPPFREILIRFLDLLSFDEPALVVCSPCAICVEREVVDGHVRDRTPTEANFALLTRLVG